MNCKACTNIPVFGENEDCFEKALDVLRKHYVFYKSALHQRDLELQQVRERNEQLNKALKLLQTNQQPNKRFKSHNSDDSWLGNVSSELSLIDDEQMGANNLNMALNSEQLFETSALSQPNNVSVSSTEIIHSPRPKESPKRNRQLDIKHTLKDRNIAGLRRTKSDWHTKESNSPMEKSWALKFVHPAKAKASEEKIGDASKKPLDKKLSLTLKKTNPSKIKQSLLHFNKSKDASLKESHIDEDMIDASPNSSEQNSKSNRSWIHRSVQNCNSNCKNLPIETVKNNVTTTNQTLDDIVFDFSPTKKKANSLHQQSVLSTEKLAPKSLKFNEDITSDCITLPNDVNLGGSTSKSDSSSVVILTPGTQDIIFVEDETDNFESDEIDTMDLLADNLEKLKRYESKCFVKKPLQSKSLETFKMPSSTFANVNNQLKVKQEKITQENVKDIKKTEEEKPSCSKALNTLNIPKLQNPLLSSDEHETEDEGDDMPKPFLIKKEPENAKDAKKLALKKRFNIDCENCEKLIEFLDEKLTDAEIQQHLDKCKRHNNPSFRHENTPPGFWNPFILSFQADDPRNEVLIDKRFKDNKK